MRKKRQKVQTDLNWGAFKSSPLKIYFKNGKDKLRLSHEKGFIFEVQIKPIEEETGEELKRCDLCKGIRQVQYIISDKRSSGNYCRSCREKYNIKSIRND